MWQVIAGLDAMVDVILVYDWPYAFPMLLKIAYSDVFILGIFSYGYDLHGYEKG